MKSATVAPKTSVIEALNLLTQPPTPEQVQQLAANLTTLTFDEIYAAILTQTNAEQKAIIENIIELIKQYNADENLSAQNKKCLAIVTKLFTSPSNPKYISLPLLLRRDVLQATNGIPENEYTSQNYLARGNVYARYNVTLVNGVTDCVAAIKNSNGAIRPVEERIEQANALVGEANKAIELLTPRLVGNSAKNILQALIFGMNYLYQNPGDTVFYVNFIEAIRKHSQESIYKVIKSLPAEQQLLLLKPVVTEQPSANPLRLFFHLQVKGQLASLSTGVLERIALRVKRLTLMAREKEYDSYNKNKYHCEMGDLYFDHNRTYKAEINYFQAVKVAGTCLKTHSNAFVGLAKCNMFRSNNQDAIYNLNDAIRTDSDNRSAHFYMALLQKSQAYRFPDFSSVRTRAAIFHLNRAYALSTTDKERVEVTSCDSYKKIFAAKNVTAEDILGCIELVRPVKLMLLLLDSCLDENTLLGSCGIDFSKHADDIARLREEGLNIDEPSSNLNETTSIELKTFHSW